MKKNPPDFTYTCGCVLRNGSWIKNCRDHPPRKK